MRPIQTREEWLRACLTRVTAGWPVGVDLPENTRISVGFPAKASGRAAGRVSEHYAPKDSDGGLWEIFISPTISNAAEVAMAVAREAVHISTGRAPDSFERVALKGRADVVIASLPPYPHSSIKGPTARAVPGEGPGSRLLKVSCPTCGYTMRITRRWLSVAVPYCPSSVGHGSMFVTGPRARTP